MSSAADEIYDSLIAPIERQMMRTVARLVRDSEEAADVFQSVLAQIWRDLKKIHRHPNPQGYILRICLSAAYDSLRRSSRRRKHEAPLELDAENACALDGNPLPEILAKENQQRILSAITLLPRHQAQALLLRVMEDQSFSAIAQSLGCSEATARSHLSKGRQRLREILFQAAN